MEASASSSGGTSSTSTVTSDFTEVDSEPGSIQELKKRKVLSLLDWLKFHTILGCKRKRQTQRQLPAYIARVADVDKDFDPLEW